MPSSHLILCRPLPLLPPIPPSIRVFSNESTLRMRWPKYWSFSPRIVPSKEIPGLISFRMDWLDLLAVHGTLKSLLQHHSSKASILRRSAFFTVQLSHPYMTTGKPNPRPPQKGRVPLIPNKPHTHTHTQLDSESEALGLDLTLLLNPMCNQISQGAHQSISKVQGWYWKQITVFIQHTFFKQPH